MVHDFQKYKEAKVILPQINTILGILNLAEKTLNYYRNYIPVAKILYTIREQRIILQTYKEDFEKIKKTKGGLGV